MIASGRAISPSDHDLAAVSAALPLLAACGDDNDGDPASATADRRRRRRRVRHRDRDAASATQRTVGTAGDRDRRAGRTATGRAAAPRPRSRRRATATTPADGDQHPGRDRHADGQSGASAISAAPPRRRSRAHGSVNQVYITDATAGRRARAGRRRLGRAAERHRRLAGLADLPQRAGRQRLPRRRRLSG